MTYREQVDGLAGAIGEALAEPPQGKALPREPWSDRLRRALERGGSWILRRLEP